MGDNPFVLICGAGPCGLAVSFVLHQFGIPNLVVEKHPGTSNHPKARGVNVRTMEFLRSWGLEDQIRTHELPQEARRLLWMDEIPGEVLGEVTLNEEFFKFSPTMGCTVPQNHVEDALVEALKTSEFSDLRFSTELLSFDPENDQVVCQLYDKNRQEKFSVTCSYLIAADGAHSDIRKALNISMQGIPSLGSYLSIYARCDLSRWLGDKPAVVYTFAEKNHPSSFLMAVDLKDRWIFGKHFSDKNTEVNDDYCKSLIRSCVKDTTLPIEILSISFWEMAALNSEHYRHNRIFLVGDAAHRIPPTGGMGMNTGFADAQNLAWKLAYVLKNYADESLLNSYEAERQPVAAYTIQWSTSNAGRMFKMLEAYREGNPALFQALVKDQNQHINHPGLDFGIVYRSGGIEVDPDAYSPSSEPGMRAPHCEIIVNGEKTSILSLYQKEYVLLLTEDAKIAKEDLPIPESYPIKIYRHKRDFETPNQDFIDYYQLDQYQGILVRPDGHIAWRGGNNE